MGAVLYILCFPNGKLYVGITTKTAEQRFRGHCRSRSRVGKAIRKYSPADCRLVVLGRGLSWSEACELEQYYIKTLETRVEQNGYNQTDGGDGVQGLVQSERQRKAARNLWRDPTTCVNMREHLRAAQLRAAEVTRARMQDQAVRTKLVAAGAAARRGVPSSAKCKEAVSATLRCLWNDPNYRAKMLEAAARGREKARANRERGMVSSD